jgi:hypothetical protein
MLERILELFRVVLEAMHCCNVVIAARVRNKTRLHLSNS